MDQESWTLPRPPGAGGLPTDEHFFGPYKEGSALKKPSGKAPHHLSPEAQALWRKLHRTYSFELPASVLLLTTLAESWDRAKSCRDALVSQPLTITDKHGGVRVHPLVVEERQCREQVARLARVLRIHTESESDV